MKISRRILLRMRNISDKIVDKIRKTILDSITFFWGGGNLVVYVVMWKNVVDTDHRWQYNTMYALFILGNYRYIHTLRISFTYCFSKGKVVTSGAFMVKKTAVLTECFCDIIIIIIIIIQPLGRSGQRPEFSQATSMVLVRCILGKFLEVACHCFPPRFRCSHVSTPGASTSSTTWEIPAAEVGIVGEYAVR